MPSGFNRLTQHYRCRLQALKKSGFPQKSIAAEIGCSQSTTSRGLARGLPPPLVAGAGRNPAA